MKLSIVLSMLLLGGMLGGCVTETADRGEEEVAATEDPLLLGQRPEWTSDTCEANGLTFLCCPGGDFMIGARLDQGRLKCTHGPNTLGAVFVDGQDAVGNTDPTQRQGMHACPWGSVMVGINEARNDLLCRNYSGITNFTSEKVDSGTQDSVGHVCEPSVPTMPLGQIYYNGRAMTGIHAIRNRFLCAY